MPIKDFQGISRVPRLGKIRLGIKTKNDKSEYPKAVDYFVCPPEIQVVHGEKPKRLPIAFHSDNIDEIFPQFYKRYGKSTGLACKGDGEAANCVNTETGEFVEIECLGRECEFYKNNQCKHIGNLSFMVRGVNRFGVYQLDTSSINSILNVNGGIDYAKRLTGGRLALVPFILEVIPQEVSPDGKKKTVWVLRLEADINAMMNSLDKTPQQLLSITPSRVPEKINIEGDLYPEQIVESLIATEKQLTRMWTMVHEANLNQEDFKKYLIEKYKINSSKELTKKEMDEVFEYLEKRIKITQLKQETLIV